MDPQQRLLLEVGWETVESACLQPESIIGSRTGVFIGMGSSDYGQRFASHLDQIGTYYLTGNESCMAPARISQFFDLRGPSLVLDSGCSSSLVAVHVACQSLRLGECSMAFAGGVNVLLHPHRTVGLSEAWLLSPSGQCNSFLEEADGYLRSEGCGLILLKLLTQAVSSNDRILGVIRGSAVNNSGRRESTTATSNVPVSSVVAEALENAGVSSREIGYIEAHSVGSDVGDVAEFNALKQIFSDESFDASEIFLGCVKTNLGHTEWASGMAGIIKVLLCLRHGLIPAHVRVGKINPKIDTKNTRLRINTQTASWPNTGQHRIAGISAFGFGGTNAHLVLEQAPDSSQHSTSRLKVDTGQESHLLVLSAQTAITLTKLAERYVEFLRDCDLQFKDVCYTACTKRSHFPHKLALVAESCDDARAQLERFIVTGGHAYPEGYKSQRICKVAFVCSDCIPNIRNNLLSKELCERFTSFRIAFERCLQLSSQYIDFTEEQERLFASSEKQLITTNAQKSDIISFSTQYALCALWQDIRIIPHSIYGFGIGATVAACVAGKITLEEAIDSVCNAIQPEKSSELKFTVCTSPNYFVSCDNGLDGISMDQCLLDSSATFDGTLLFMSEQYMDDPHFTGCTEKFVSLSKSFPQKAMLEALASLYVRGASVDLAQLYSAQSNMSVELPGYPFARIRCWSDLKPFQREIVTNLDGSNMLSRLMAAPKHKHCEMVACYLEDIVRSFIGEHDILRIDRTAGFFEMGIPSIGAIAFHNELCKSFSISLPSTVVFDYPNINLLCDYLLKVVVPEDSSTISKQQRAAGRKDSRQKADLLQMTTEELELLIRKKAEELNSDS
jgi:acyl transferase domain-containing protein